MILSINTVEDILGAGKPIFYAVKFCINSLQTSVLLFCNKQYNTIKGSLVDSSGEDGPLPDLSEIEFYGENAIKMYDIDSTYIDRLLGTYSANNQNIRDEIEKALQK